MPLRIGGSLELSMDRVQRVYTYNTWILSDLVNVENRTGFKGQADSLATTGGGEEGD